MISKKKLTLWNPPRLAPIAGDFLVPDKKRTRAARPSGGPASGVDFEQQLRASELSYRRLFEAANDGIAILNVETGRIDDVNPFLSKLLGFSHAEMLGKTIGELSPFKDIEPNQIMLERLQRDGCIRYEDLPLETIDGRKVEVEFVSNVYRSGDKKVIQCNIRDITERKQAEKTINALNVRLEGRVVERTAQLQASNDELEKFTYSVSHDLRAPVRHIMGFVELLQKDVGPTLSKGNKLRLSTIFHAAKRMGQLVDDLLAFSHLARTDLKKTEVDLDEVVRETLADFAVETKVRHIAWNVHPLPKVHADRALLQAAVVNLVANAVKFTGTRDKPKIEIGCYPSAGHETTIFIRDNGVGFDPKYSTKIFEVFQRLHSQSEFEGTGIGLANVQRIIHRHGGRAWGTGKVNQGATFFISIPNKLRRKNEH